ncbi:fungal specific transcription [Cordyceps militaris]|uniref:Fungal specific transcription n=1 Tax=Cordyceps militaris TaxID=73501 RepID=A0A2H4SUG5_CORMI|nr:fungal specific transcription [Cordyceps militaris]
MPRATLVTLARRSCPTPNLYRHTLGLQRPFSMAGSTQSPSSSSSKGSNDDIAPAPTADQQQGLPAPGEGTPVTLDVSGEGSTVKLAALGPLVVNVDGTVARITNWKEMTEQERETTVRMVGRRNKQRLEALKKRKEEEEGAAGAR